MLERDLGIGGTTRLCHHHYHLYLSVGCVKMGKLTLEFFSPSDQNVGV